MTAVRSRIFWITAQEDGTEHAVTDEAQEASRAAGVGWYEAVCGAVFLAAAMEAGPVGRCASCRAFLRAQYEMRDINERMRRPSWLSRLCHRKQPADVGIEMDPQPSAGADSAPKETTAASVPAPARARHRRRRRHAT